MVTRSRALLVTSVWITCLGLISCALMKANKEAVGHVKTVAIAGFSLEQEEVPMLTFALVGGGKEEKWLRSSGSQRDGDEAGESKANALAGSAPRF